MNKTKVKFESQETVTGRVRGSAEWIEYEAILRVKDSEKKPVSLELKFVPPHPLVVNMPEHKTLEAESITQVFLKLVHFFDKFCIDFK